MNDKLYIPKKINIGFQNRDDTYTKKLGYIIYWDDKGVLRKEKSWQSWREIKLGNKELDNVPTEGFVLNKGVGGRAGSWSSWNIRRETVRIWDPRDFEFEISVDNLLFILTECDCTKGKGLSGEFVYAWAGTELMLLPVGTEDYRQSQQFTALQGTKVAAKDLIEGATYIDKQGAQLIYLGKHMVYTDLRYNYSKNINPTKKFVFCKNSGNKKNPYFFVALSSIGTLSSVLDESIVSNYSNIMESLDKHELVGKFVNYKANITQIFKKGSNYSRRYEDFISDYDDPENGEYYTYEYSGGSSSIDDMTREKLKPIKFEVKLFKHIIDDTYQSYFIEAIKVSTPHKIADGKGGYKYRAWKRLGYKLIESDIYDLSNNTITRTTPKNKNTARPLYTKKELEAMDFLKIEVDGGKGFNKIL